MSDFIGLTEDDVPGAKLLKDPKDFSMIVFKAMASISWFEAIR